MVSRIPARLQPVGGYGLSEYYAVYEYEGLFLDPVISWEIDNEGYYSAHVEGEVIGTITPASQGENLKCVAHWFDIVRDHWNDLRQIDRDRLSAVHGIAVESARALNLNRQGGADI